MSFKNKKVAITGGAGLIGSYVVEQLVGLGAKVIVIDDFSKGRIENLSAVKDRVDIREGDLENLKFTTSALQDSDIVFHLASRAYGIGYSRGHATEVIQHNERITNNLFKTIEEITPEYVLITSSSCVYPDDGPDIIPELPVFSGEPEIANWGYGWAKRFLEQKAVIYSQETKIPIGIVRPFNIYGERYNWVGENSQAIPMLVKRIMDGENPVVVWGSGNQRRSYVHADDCARIMISIAQDKYCYSPVNIGTEDTVSISELVMLICKVGKVKPNIKYDLTKPEGRYVKSANVELLKNTITDLNLKVSLEEGIERMLEWYNITFSKIGN